MKTDALLSVVIPVLDEIEVLPELYRRLHDVMRSMGGRPGARGERLDSVGGGGGSDDRPDAEFQRGVQLGTARDREPDDGEGWGPMSSGYLDELLGRLAEIPFLEMLPVGKTLLKYS